jgi:hypothetical protein
MSALGQQQPLKSLAVQRLVSAKSRRRAVFEISQSDLISNVLVGKRFRDNNNAQLDRGDIQILPDVASFDRR